MERVLVIDDDSGILRVLKGLLEKEGYQALTAHDVDTALPFIGENGPDLIITDLKMPGRSGMDLLVLAQDLCPRVPVVMMTAFADVEAAVAAMKQGAYDFITKPFDEHELLNVIRKALSESGKNRELVSAYFEKGSGFSNGIIGTSPAIQDLLETVRMVAPTDSSVLITGETGVGKELVARAVHQESPRRREHPFVKVNCAAIPDTLLESELFGYEKGAFTGAVTSKPGRFEIAHRGTIFLDEIGEMPLHLQTKLLGVLEDRAFERVGGVKNITIDMRVVAATNTDLRVAVRQGGFRHDLFYRLHVVPVHIPPLRERKEDLFPLAAHILGRLSAKYRRENLRLSPEAIAALGSYDWPGNVRELENVLERMVVTSEATTLGPEQLPPEIVGPFASNPSSSLREKINGLSRITERQMIADALEKTGQNRTRAARLLGISRRALQNKIRQYGL